MRSYMELVEAKASEPISGDIRRYLVEGEQVSVTLRIPDTLRDAAKEEAALRGMSFSAFVRTCMKGELAKLEARRKKEKQFARKNEMFEQAKEWKRCMAAFEEGR